MQRLELAAQHHATEFRLRALVDGVGETAAVGELCRPLTGRLPAQIAGGVALAYFAFSTSASHLDHDLF
jgi:hypothetical protein